MRFVRLVLTGLVVAISLAACGGGGKPVSTSTAQPSASFAPSGDATIAGPSSTQTPSSAIPGNVGVENPSSTMVTDVATSLTMTAYPSPDVDLSVNCPPPTITAKGSTELMTMEQFGIQYHCVVNQFPWPIAYFPDVDTIMNEWENPGTGDVQAGLEYTGLAVLNECAWYNAWLDARKSGDAAAEQQALWAIVNITPNIPNLIPGYPPGAALGSGPDSVSGIMRAAAQLGNTSRIQTFVEQQGCQDPRSWMAN